MKILYVTTIGTTMRFFEHIIKKLVADGHEVQIACNNSADDVPAFYHQAGLTIHDLACSRSPFRKGTLVAIRQIKKLVAAEAFDIVHCHTPIASVCTRLACRKARKTGTKVIYTAHGFHFYQGAPWSNWLIYYTAEKLCARYTDVLITINREDYRRAQKNLKIKQICYVPGVGISVDRFAACDVDCSRKREELGIPRDACLLLSVGELNENKNHRAVIQALAALQDKDLYYAVAGQGSLKDELISLAKEFGIADRVLLLGQRTDVAELYRTADVYVHPSFREGLPVAIMEALAAGLPIICTSIRGNVDLVKHERNGIVVALKDDEGLRSAIERLKNDKGKIGAENSSDALAYDYVTINDQIYDIYFTEEAHP